MDKDGYLEAHELPPGSWQLEAHLERNIRFHGPPATDPQDIATLDIEHQASLKGGQVIQTFASGDRYQVKHYGTWRESRTNLRTGEFERHILRGLLEAVKECIISGSYRRQ